jgi:DNA-binding NarL/FixJ family response regulator
MSDGAREGTARSAGLKGSAGVDSATDATPPHLAVLIVDDHPVVRAGLTGMLAAEPDLDVVAEAADGAEAVRLALELGPDVVLMDLRMAGMDGVEATARLAAEAPAIKVLILTTYDTDADIVRAVEAGATGYLLKDTPRAELAEAVRLAARGETVLAPAVAAKLVNRMRQPAPPPLTPREREVLALVARGLANAEIGRELFISEATVKTHLVRVFGKLGVDDRTAAVTKAMAAGLL